MPDQIPQVGLETSEGVPNPADGSIDSIIFFVPVGQPHPLRNELEIGLDTAIVTIRSLRLAYPGYTYVADMTPAEAPRPIKVPKLVYGVARRRRPPRVHEATTPPEAPTMRLDLPLPSPLIQMVPGGSNQVARPNSPVWDVPTQMIIWRRRAYHEGSAFSVQVRWHPKTGEITTIAFPSNMPLETSDNHRATALNLLREVERGGRPLGTRYYTRDQFHAAYPGAWAEAQRRRGAHTRDADIARALGISYSTMKRYLRQYGRPVLP
jgi:hypothetical protein